MLMYEECLGRLLPAIDNALLYQMIINDQCFNVLEAPSLEKAKDFAI